MHSFNKSQFAGTLLALLMLLALMNSAFFFLGKLKLSLIGWMAFNACSLASVIYLCCYLLYRSTKNDALLAFPLLPLYYYGTMGLFLMPWNATNFFPQITHIILTLNVLWILYSLLSNGRYEALGKGLILAVLVFGPLFAGIQTYVALHPLV